MEILSVRDYRNNLAASFDRADYGERVIIRRKNSLYALVNIGNDDVTLSAAQERKIDCLAESINRSWRQVKEIESGNIPGKPALSFLDEL